MGSATPGECSALMAEWVDNARNLAILGSCPKSLPSVRSGLKCWLRFAREALGREGRELPPSQDGLLAWSMTFRCDRTFSNYLGHVKTGCMLLGLSCEAVDSQVLKRAKLAIAKRTSFRPRMQLFLGLRMVENMLEHLLAHPEWSTTVLWAWTAYVFLLRVPSECLPLVTAGGIGEESMQSVMHVHDDHLELVLASRQVLLLLYLRMCLSCSFAFQEEQIAWQQVRSSCLH